ncbi:MAG: hypothetical protein MJ245_05075 [Clostridia bacterium]|nr:hypothetical protein [Clostridia bacterium]
MLKFKNVFTILFTLLFILNLSSISNAFAIHDSADNLLSIDLVLKERSIVEGDAILLGDIVNFAGDCKGNIVALANTAINITAENYRNSILVAKGDINVKGNSNAIYAFGNSIKINGYSKSAYLIAKQVSVAGTIDGDLTIIATTITLDPNLVVNGSLNIESAIEPEYPDGTLQDKVSFTKVEENEKKESLTSKLLRLTKFLLWLAPTGLITALIYIKLLGPVKRQGVKLLRKSPLNVFLSGLVMLIGMPTVSFIFMIAIIGLPTALIILMIYLICFLLAVPCLGVALGDYIFPKQSDYISGLAGTLILSLIVALPYIGVIVYLIALLYTYGMFSIAIFNIARKENRTRRKRNKKDKSVIEKIKNKIKTTKINTVETKDNKEQNK